MADLPDMQAMIALGIIASLGAAACLGDFIATRRERASLERDTWAGRRGALLALADRVEAGAALSPDDFAPLDGAAHGIRQAALAAYRGSVSALSATGQRLGVPLSVDNRKALAAMLRAKAG